MLVSINTLTSSNKNLTKDEANALAYKGWITKNVPWSESAIKSIMGFEWMSGLSSDGYKRRTSISAIGSIFLDIDDETIYGDNLLNFVHKSLCEIGLSHAITTSTNHLKTKWTKRGVELPACPRIKLMIPLEQPVQLPDEQSKDNWNYSRLFILEHFSKVLRAINLDASSLDVNRASFRMDTKADNWEWRFFSGKSFNVHPLLRVMPQPEKVSYDFDGDQHERDTLEAAESYFSAHRDRDEWLKVAAAVYHCFGADILKRMTTLSRGELESFKRSSGRTCTAGTIFYYAKMHGWQPRVDYIEEQKKKRQQSQPVNSLKNFNSYTGY